MCAESPFLQSCCRRSRWLRAENAQDRRAYLYASPCREKAEQPETSQAMKRWVLRKRPGREAREVSRATRRCDGVPRMQIEREQGFEADARASLVVLTTCAATRSRLADGSEMKARKVDRRPKQMKMNSSPNVVDRGLFPAQN
ncbi:hypothetical protein PHSY_002810 [Pseudozyma hubeiensis SY62]|uniref:Uncharacterized protein n=1 Tax=Pseudozyma hubeiensis (strain SY62) TaxID=1305764 RepID=R9PAY0_PSEHS|nr:hypothetical protein PHSY_002810 [Pseudozyma hubeiensis SY62]GAC95235.1 hypothetical protein PHSY_002810 [Pseudozyma hubeiensis SY62]